MKPIKRVIREEHVQSIIDGVLYFPSCQTFVDLLEFRFGYCWDQFEFAREEGKREIFDRCIQETFRNEYVQQRINETVISCWSYNSESPYMWEVYGSSKAAIIVTADEDELVTLIREKWGDDASAGHVRYGFKTSLVHPEFIESIDNPRWKEDYDLFFHKHEFYEFEKEFRAVIFGQTEAIRLALPDEMVKEITISPLAPLQPSLLTGLKKRFGDRVSDSRLHWSLPVLKTVSVEDYMRDEETAKTAEIIELFKKSRHLKAQDQTKGWNDPKAPPIPREQFEVSRQLAEVKRELARAIEALNTSKSKLSKVQID
jgi:hypothetical protein